MDLEEEKIRKKFEQLQNSLQDCLDTTGDSRKEKTKDACEKFKDLLLHSFRLQNLKNTEKGVGQTETLESFVKALNELKQTLQKFYTDMLFFEIYFMDEDKIKRIDYNNTKISASESILVLSKCLKIFYESAKAPA